MKDKFQIIQTAGSWIETTVSLKTAESNKGDEIKDPKNLLSGKKTKKQQQKPTKNK